MNTKERRESEMNEKQSTDMEILVFAEQKKVAETISALVDQQGTMNAQDIVIARIPEKTEALYAHFGSLVNIENVITLKSQQNLRVSINAELEKANRASLENIDDTATYKTIEDIERGWIEQETKIFGNYHASVLSILDKLDEIEGLSPRELAD